MQYDGSIRIDTIKIEKILAALINTESIKKSCLWFIFSQIAIYFAQSNDDESMEKIE